MKTNIPQFHHHGIFVNLFKITSAEMTMDCHPRSNYFIA